MDELEAWNCRRHTTQFLSGHGCFGYYLHRFKKLDEAICVDCKSLIDDAEHATFHCDRWWSSKRALEVDISKPTEPETVVDEMIQNKEIWRAVKKFVDMVMSNDKKRRGGEDSPAASTSLV
ncbi:Reverse transcriptase domain-containing protein [Aphis craccivora]|uniref:Reverse transcriptase domain-containing protein n=1 Tax=Aphis craccivora TaxID=307492 RepID=A0A6G0W520_APHCR|nr:Reverse transcriptase domain-containing protein [Aphis craccivora]